MYINIKDIYIYNNIVNKMFRVSYFVFRISYIVFSISYFVLRISYNVLRMTYFVFRIWYIVFRISYFVLRISYFVFRTSYIIFRISYIVYRISYFVYRISYYMVQFTQTGLARRDRNYPPKLNFGKCKILPRENTWGKRQADGPWAWSILNCPRHRGPFGPGIRASMSSR